MDLFPAIDLRDGRCVRLYQGDYDRETVYGEDPVAVAEGFAAAGARWIHVVDLDAARTGQARNRPLVGAVANAVAGRARVQAGGGVRDEAAAAELLAAGVARVVLGTAAVDDPGLVERLAAQHPGSVAVGLDARDGQVAIRGWTAPGGLSVLDALARAEGSGAAAAVVTSIQRDGTLAGPDLDLLASALEAGSLDVVASGGVGRLEDLRALAGLEAGGRRLAGAVVGRALYEGRFGLAEALAAAGGEG